MRYITHKREDGEYQFLKDHLIGVARRMAESAKAFRAEKCAYRAGLLHDIGKYSPNGQERQLHPECAARADHSTAGAQEAFRLRDLAAAFAIAGHHAGLSDLGTSERDGTFAARMKKTLIHKDDPSAWRSEIQLGGETILPPPFLKEGAFSQSFFIRMLFSCLVDADYLDTEAFMKHGETERGSYESINALSRRLLKTAQDLLNAPNPRRINQKRCEILKRCLEGGSMEPGLYTLTVPTGGGKTISSLAFALTHAAAHGLKRVIYVIPYTSIIEQNAKVFSDILGEENVLVHHANVDFPDEEDAERTDARRRMLACENWDAPVVVTTAVQFFESLFAAKTSRCRKLHNIADSVVIFDEAQMLPVPYIRPCVMAIAELVRHYGVTAVLCTATQPALNGIVHHSECAPGLPIREIMTDPDDLYEFFRRVRFQNEGALTVSRVAAALSERQQALCIVNSRGRAAELYGKLSGEGVYYLTTLLTPRDRTAKLSEIRLKLAAGERCVVVATSLIEAGVDVDFPTVWREINGLDSILQAAGRCNRENKRLRDESVVHIFEFEGARPGQFAQNIASTRHVLSLHTEIDSREAIRCYYEDLLTLKGRDRLDTKQILEGCKKWEFRTVAETFKLIDENTVTVYIPTAENADLISRLRAGVRSRKLFRELGHYAVSIYPQHYRALEHAMEKISGGAEGFDVLADASLYDSERGLAQVAETGIGYFM